MLCRGCGPPPRRRRSPAPVDEVEGGEVDVAEAGEAGQGLPHDERLEEDQLRVGEAHVVAERVPRRDPARLQQREAAPKGHPSFGGVPYISHLPLASSRASEAPGTGRRPETSRIRPLNLVPVFKDLLRYAGRAWAWTQHTQHEQSTRSRSTAWSTAPARPLSASAAAVVDCRLDSLRAGDAVPLPPALVAAECQGAADAAARSYKEKFPALKCALLGVRRGTKGSCDADPSGWGVRDMIYFAWSGFAAGSAASAAVVACRLDNLRAGTAVPLPPALRAAERTRLCVAAADKATKGRLTANIRDVKAVQSDWNIQRMEYGSPGLP
eukprot:gene10692-biopygen10246